MCLSIHFLGGRVDRDVQHVLSDPDHVHNYSLPLFNFQRHLAIGLRIASDEFTSIQYISLRWTTCGYLTIMAGRSASPPHRNHQRGESSRGSGRRYGDDRSARRYPEEDRGYSSRYGDTRDDRRGGDRRENYSERDRERERAKDRDRYDTRREEGGNGRSRRSASPPGRRASRPLSAQGSRSGSVSPTSKAKPDFAPSGLLAAETNTVRAVNGDSTVLKYNEPPEARKPILGWRLYVFKGSEQVGEIWSLFCC